jgi:H+/Cl- antiporter ClcA
LAALISTIEVLSIVAVFIYTSLRADTETSTFKEKCLRAWFWFLFISPFVTGTMVVLMASDISCDPEDDLDMHQPICQVGIRLIKATALCRAGIM